MFNFVTAFLTDNQTKKKKMYRFNKWSLYVRKIYTFNRLYTQQKNPVLNQFRLSLFSDSIRTGTLIQVVSMSLKLLVSVSCCKVYIYRVNIIIWFFSLHLIFIFYFLNYSKVSCDLNKTCLCCNIEQYGGKSQLLSVGTRTEFKKI